MQLIMARTSSSAVAISQCLQGNITNCPLDRHDDVATSHATCAMPVSTNQPTNHASTSHQEERQAGDGWHRITAEHGAETEHAPAGCQPTNEPTNQATSSM